MPVYYTENKGKIYERWTCPVCGKIISIVSPCYVSDVSYSVKELAIGHFAEHYENVDKRKFFDTFRDIKNNRIEDTETTMDKWIGECVLYRLDPEK